MIQRISVRIRLISDDRTLLVRRAEGRPSILGKYELPGGRVLASEQPEDAARRYLESSLGIVDRLNLQLEDVVTYTDSDDRTIQYAVIVYRAFIGKKKRGIVLSGHYDKYVWYSFGKLDTAAITEVSQLVLGANSSRAADSLDDTRENSGASGGSTLVVYSDGGSRGNPGPSAAGYVILRGDQVIDQGGEYLGITTNNQAEYHGVRLGLEAAVRLGVDEVEVKVDSMLVANQLKGVYKIKNRELWPVNERVRDLVAHFKKVKFTHVPREMNRLADGMVNRTLDQQKSLNVI
ncbi:hypothetical protein B7Z00_00220 [Candidatus Saccharibacteria bacterium 32-50-10]|nr:MAG: hypothetical protein B7Z00_00220 [Candidatus Saccharibacteria bacterium 32-50-10]